MDTNRLIIALDFPSPEQALMFVKQLDPSLCRLKVGFELFVAAGPDFVSKLIERGFYVFLDLKFHDIPNTVAAACRSAAKLGVWMMNVHALGGEDMMQRASSAVKELENPPLLIAVTILTSMDQNQLSGIGLHEQAADQVMRLARLTQNCGLDGVVCSAQEAKLLRNAIGKDFELVTPGIRPVNSSLDDQSRVMTPSQAISAGSSYIVVGRPITQATDPLNDIHAINEEIVLSLQGSTAN